jgi:cystathionine gamma-synthase
VTRAEAPTPGNAVSPPIFQTSVYAFQDIDEVDALLGGRQSGYSYTRGGNPNFDALAAVTAALEETEAAVVTASGTASLLTAMMALLPEAGRVLLSREIYGGTVGITRGILARFGFKMEWVDAHDPEAVEAALQGPPGIMVLESISNPMGRVTPLDEIIPLAHRYGAPVLVDNTFATPYHARPAGLGADLVVHSLTKFMGGHSDMILGAVAGARDRVAAVSGLVDSAGFTPDPFAAWLALRGVRTLALRMERSSANALALASALEAMPQVARVYYPGLPSHPDHQVARRLLTRGFGSVVSMSLQGGYGAVQRMVRRLKLVRFVPSLGDVSTTVSHPVVASHRELTVDEKAAVGIDDSVVRISVGIEHAADLIADFRHALG